MHIARTGFPGHSRRPSIFRKRGPDRLGEFTSPCPSISSDPDQPLDDIVSFAKRLLDIHAMRGTVGLFTHGSWVSYVLLPCLPSTGSSLPLRRQTKEMVRAPGHAAADIDSHFLGRFNKERFSGKRRIFGNLRKSTRCFPIPEAILRRRLFPAGWPGSRSRSVNILITKQLQSN